VLQILYGYRINFIVIHLVIYKAKDCTKGPSYGGHAIYTIIIGHVVEVTVSVKYNM